MERGALVRRIARYVCYSGAAVLVLWFPLTWFLFGSAHPCGILAHRTWKKESAYTHLEVTREIRDATEFITGRETDPLPDLKKRLATAYDENRQRAYRLAPVECVRGAIRWTWDPKSDEIYSLLREMAFRRK